MRRVWVVTQLVNPPRGVWTEPRRVPVEHKTWEDCSLDLQECLDNTQVFRSAGGDARVYLKSVMVDG